MQNKNIGWIFKETVCTSRSIVIIPEATRRANEQWVVKNESKAFLFVYSLTLNEWAINQMQANLKVDISLVIYKSSLFTDVSQSMCSWKFCKIPRTTPVPVSLKKACLQPATLLKRRHRCFPVNFVKFLRIPFSKKSSGQLPINIYSANNLFSWSTKHSHCLERFIMLG